MSCSDWFLEDPVYRTATVVQKDLIEDSGSNLSAEEYEKLCIRTEYYFCPGVSGPLMRIEITKDICAEPPVVLSMSECKEHLECDPHYYDLGEKPCFTDDGKAGTYHSFCVKGFLQDGPCEASHDNDEDVYTSNEIYSSEEVFECGPVDYVESCDTENVDILVIVDLSASMLPEIQLVHDAIDLFVSEHEDAEHIMWSLIVGPKNNGEKPGNHNYLYLAADLGTVNDFQNKLSDVLDYDMIGQYEMLFDALYLSLRNISDFLPYEAEELLWPVWVGKVIDESIPPIEDFYVSWRKDSTKVIVVFTDEPGQSFLMPASEVGKSYNTNNTITHDKLKGMLESIGDLSLYVFADSATGSHKQWSELADTTPGDAYDLNDDSMSTYSNITQILNSQVCQ